MGDEGSALRSVMIPAPYRCGKYSGIPVRRLQTAKFQIFQPWQCRLLYGLRVNSDHALVVPVILIQSELQDLNTSVA